MNQLFKITRRTVIEEVFEIELPVPIINLSKLVLNDNNRTAMKENQISYTIETIGPTHHFHVITGVE